MGHVVLLRGDGIGPEISAAAMHVLRELGALDRVEIVEAEAGSEWWRSHGGDSYVPEETWRLLKDSDACIKAPFTTLYTPGAPRSAVVALRQRFGLYANVRPIKSFRRMVGPLGPVRHIYVRENTEDLYAGIEYSVSPGVAISIRKTTYDASSRLMRRAFDVAVGLSWRRVIVVHKATVIRETDGLFVRAAHDVADKYGGAGVELQEMLVDNVAQQLVLNPGQFDDSVVAGPNLYMDILSEESAALAGGIGVVYSANMGDNYAMFEPAHGSAPSLKGRGIANPTAMILAAAAAMNYLGERAVALAIVEGVERVIEEGRTLTPDMGGSSSTMDVARAVARSAVDVLASGAPPGNPLIFPWVSPLPRYG
ncbi:MAG: isocitrate/isopropylmalate family dehydrogenase [Nitrososphaeria archaeon]|jgi:isocitrate dehydrogenase